jgi:hypothetical protein
MLSKQYDQLIRDTVLDGWNEKRLSVLQCAFAAAEAVLAQRTDWVTEALASIKRRLEIRLNDWLIEMKPECDDSITGFNDAQTIVSELFADIAKEHAQRTEPAQEQQGNGACVGNPDDGYMYGMEIASDDHERKLDAMEAKRQIKGMVDRFLGWKLPENFNPDGGISFQKTANENTLHERKNEPTGTNLLDASQAEEMIRYMLYGLASPHAPAQEQLGRDRTDEWESRMDAQKQAAQPIEQSAGNNSSGAEQINVPQCTAPVQQSVGTDELQRIQMTAALAAARPVIEAERDKQWSAWGIVEVAVRNQSVADYMKHWEERATKAEANADFLRRCLKKYIEEARKGLHSEAEIRAAMLQRWSRLGKRLAEDLFTILNAHKEERVTVESFGTEFVVVSDGKYVSPWFKFPQDAERYATGLRAEIREGKQ